MGNFNIDAIYHAAAYKHVPIMENNVMQCIKNNVLGTLNLVEMAIESRVKSFILISSDKAVNPTNFMGASKRMAELICQTYDTIKSKTSFSIVRFGNVLGSSGSVVPLFKKQIENREPITLTHLDVTRYFMTVSEAAQLVIQAGSMYCPGVVFVLDMEKPIKILDLAKNMVTLSGLKPVIAKEKFQKEMKFITVTGLRPEKLYEELSYSGELIKTTHPRILTIEEPSSNQLNSILPKLQNINNDDLGELIKTISFITKDIPI